jgi:hypothetical protein
MQLVNKEIIILLWGKNKEGFIYKRYDGIFGHKLSTVMQCTRFINSSVKHSSEQLRKANVGFEMSDVNGVIKAIIHK